MSEASATGNQMKATRLEHFIRATLDVPVFFASTIAKSMVGGRAWSGRATDGLRRGSLTSETFANRTPGEISDPALSLISGRVFHRIIRHLTISGRRIDKAVAIPFFIH